MIPEHVRRWLDDASKEDRAAYIDFLNAKEEWDRVDLVVEYLMDRSS